MSSRTVAIKTLVEQQRTGKPIDLVFEKMLNKHPLSSQDRQLAMAISLGVIRRRNEIDFVISSFSSTPLDKIRIEVLAGLRVGVMQLLFMDRIPPSAAVNETIIGVGKQPPWLKGFMNGVLREISRNLTKAHNILTTLSKQKGTNHPGWLVDQYIKQFGKETAFAICEANNELPTLTLRINPRHCSMEAFIQALQAQDIIFRPGIFNPLAVTILSPVKVEDLPGFKEGWFYIQDEAAQLIALFFGGSAGGLFLDACAGLGGKTILLDQTLDDQAAIHAVEPHKERQTLFHENLARCTSRDVPLFSESLADYASHCQTQYDGILIDSPCSGLGVIRRHPDIRWNRTMKDLNQFSTTQKNLLHQAAPLVREGGFMVYVTCSTSVIENEQVIDAFLGRHPEFSLDQPEYDTTLQPFFTSGYLQTLPHQGLDGFFAARLRKKTAA
jgi:16S rRNA (cytosine967-C5)-methyltransferase